MTYMHVYPSEKRGNFSHPYYKKFKFATITIDIIAKNFNFDTVNNKKSSQLAKFIYWESLGLLL